MRSPSAETGPATWRVAMARAKSWTEPAGSLAPAAGAGTVDIGSGRAGDGGAGGRAVAGLDAAGTVAAGEAAGTVAAGGAAGGAKGTSVIATGRWRGGAGKPGGFANAKINTCSSAASARQTPSRQFDGAGAGNAGPRPASGRDAGARADDISLAMVLGLCREARRGSGGPTVGSLAQTPYAHAGETPALPVRVRLPKIRRTPPENTATEAGA